LPVGSKCGSKYLYIRAIFLYNQCVIWIIQYNMMFISQVGQCHHINHHKVYALEIRMKAEGLRKNKRWIICVFSIICHKICWKLELIYNTPQSFIVTKQCFFCIHGCF
jgi:hypothetical protein